MIDLDSTDLAQIEARLVTSKGDLVVGFRPDKAPAHVRNFLNLAQDGFYDHTAFHRVIKNFMIQGGCPNTKPGSHGVPGTGSPGHHVHAEFNDLEHRRGVLSMARSSDPDSAGSQFFIVHAEHAGHLDGQYTAFGYLKDGLDVLDEIASAEVTFDEGGARSRPAERIELERIELAVAEAPAGDDAGDSDDGDATEADS